MKRDGRPNDVQGCLLLPNEGTVRTIELSSLLLLAQ